MSEQWYFEFNEWKQAFAQFYRWKARDASFCLVISEDPYVSGYWVERNAEPDEETHVYLSLESVRELEVRVRAAVKNQRGFAMGTVVL